MLRAQQRSRGLLSHIGLGRSQRNIGTRWNGMVGHRAKLDSRLLCRASSHSVHRRGPVSPGRGSPAEGSDSSIVFRIVRSQNIPNLSSCRTPPRRDWSPSLRPTNQPWRKKLAFRLVSPPELAAFWEQALPNGLLSRLQRCCLAPGSSTQAGPLSAVIPPGNPVDARCPDFHRLARPPRKNGSW